ncbi:hypothetical protein NG755_11035 [Aliarcobacter cryaerophilus]|jgi:hypothetical protein|uniref:ABC-three component system middle component 6 n=1 Tax=Aliarcobacter cryaerophilus TaxID=28198 RepID=UPI0021B245F9|nr:ABC-three component system middle component 6 [Aliarcobacter cryaerophilus]MCT7445265.1 hypothetical protein [Aliarcobacter cryaerophilus]MCT7480175.1 hypothetical protein [Aliarcobacter cryaerophilus]MCT7489304.1 hypothetical protein [Aliarcobacter cryaerophilus]
MLMPTKIIKPVDSIFSISAFVLKALESNDMRIDELIEEVNKTYYKEISFDKLVLSLNFLYLINKIELKNEIITINI